MKFLREERLTDHFSLRHLEESGRKVWMALREKSEQFGVPFEALKYNDYSASYIAGFPRCLGVLHSTNTAKAFFGNGWADEVVLIFFQQEFDSIEAKHRKEEAKTHKFAHGFADGVYDGVAYFSDLPFEVKGLHANMSFMEQFARLDWAIRHWATDK